MTIAAFQSQASRRSLRMLVLARLALLAVLFHACLPVTLHAAQRVQSANGIEQTVLCSALGTRTIALKDGLPVDADTEKPLKASKNCPVCLSAAQTGHTILPVAPSVPVPGMAITILFGAAPDSTLARAGYRPAQARAPPQA